MSGQIIYISGFVICEMPIFFQVQHNWYENFIPERYDYASRDIWNVMACRHIEQYHNYHYLKTKMYAAATMPAG